MILVPLAAALAATALQAQTAPAQSAPTQSAPADTTSAQGTAGQASSAPAASDQAKVAVGAAVSDQSGAPVGTIETIADGNAVISTGTNKVAVPLTAIGPGANGLVTTVTRAQLDATAAAGPAQVKAMLVPGASVKGKEGTEIGTVKAADDKLVTITTGKGDVRVPAESFAVQSGGLVVGMTADQFAAAVAKSPAPAKKRRG
ncbi:hypothetical protein [Sphingomonas bacterium]|uniref:hypothetical protein n=1 Tax=Sphingomonas bacterium TaxID=1895847 RepID=UPI0015771A19|nr:hypothetical protein [Sphingomonas bacterium]